MLVGRYPALLDANVLHPAFVRGALLWFAEQRLFQPHWTAEILTEWRRSVLRRFKDLDEGKLLAKQAEMNEFFPDAEITGYERFTPCVELPDGGDNHVLAAAVVGRCAGIVTSNTKHFPAEVTKPLGIEVIHPDDFIVNIIDVPSSSNGSFEAKSGRIPRTISEGGADPSPPTPEPAREPNIE
ncbi:MAG TPA: PIN domain-containing protein, partial [Sphingomicrobium sp.]|nr:PIN domain-containing protein [Sphingomicrobium sp.]